MPETSPRHIVIAGGNGHMGRLAQRWFRRAGHRVTILARKPVAPAAEGVEIRVWDGATLDISKTGWAAAIDGCDVLLNLAGRSVNCRYTPKNRAEILQSRVASTRVLGEAIGRAKQPPAVWLNSSTATIYRHAEDRPQDEATGELGSGFSVGIAMAWEEMLNHAAIPDSVRRVAMRTAIVLDPEPGGALEVFVRLVKRGFGGRMGSGRQMMSWVSGRDWLRAVDHIIATPSLAGPVNIAAPNPLPNQAFMQALRRALGIRFALPSPRWLLAIGAFLIRTETELPLKSRWVIPTKLRESGFAFEHVEWPASAAAILSESA